MVGINWITVYLFLILFAGTTDSRNDQFTEPSFAGPIENVTVPIGREATLSCIVQNLGAYKVSRY